MYIPSYTVDFFIDTVVQAQIDMDNAIKLIPVQEFSQDEVSND